MFVGVGGAGGEAVAGGALPQVGRVAGEGGAGGGRTDDGRGDARGTHRGREDARTVTANRQPYCRLIALLSRRTRLIFFHD